METAEGIHYDGALKDVSSDPEGLGRPITQGTCLLNGSLSSGNLLIA